MPALESLVDAGVIGNLRTLAPPLSPLVWASMATGMRADKHGVLDGGMPRTVGAFWNILARDGRRAIVVNWPASHPAELIDGVMVSSAYPRPTGKVDDAWPLPLGAVYPERLAEPLADLRVHPAHLALSHLLPFVPRAAEIGQPGDWRLRQLAIAIADCSSVHAAATWLMEREPWDVMAVYYDTLAHLGYAFMPYHPPRMRVVKKPDFEMYAGVVDGAYRFQDMMLRRLLDLAGEDTTVILVSAHGFHSGHRRPGIVQRASRPEDLLAWHRDFGVLCMRGPGLRRDERIDSASVLDVVPTVLTLFGLPVADDMDGRPLAHAFETPPSLARVPSWEPAPRTPAVGVAEPTAVVEPSAGAGPEAGPGTSIERRFTLARVKLDAERTAEAAPLLEALVHDVPTDVRFALRLAECRWALGQRGACRELLEAILAGDDAPTAHVLMARVLFGEGAREAALEHLRRAERASSHAPELQAAIGDAYIEGRSLDDAARLFRAALAVDTDSGPAHHGLARVHLARGRALEATEEALSAVGLLHQAPAAHFTLGVALARLGRHEDAVRAFETCLALQPAAVKAHLWLARLHERTGGDALAALAHRRRAAELGGARPDGDPTP